MYNKHVITIYYVFYIRIFILTSEFQFTIMFFFEAASLWWFYGSFCMFFTTRGRSVFILAFLQIMFC